MPDVEYRDGAEAVIDLADHAEITTADSVTVSASELLRSVGAGIGSESFDIGLNAKPILLGQLR